MPLYMNGTLIPENVANALYFNGTNITDVYFNGVQVWHQSLFNGVWSNSSLVLYAGSVYNGMGVSSNAFRALTVKSSAQAYGAWLYASSSGLPSGSSLILAYYSTYDRGFSTTPTTFQYVDTFGPVVGTITFSTTSKFSGSSLTNGTAGYETSGGLIRHINTTGQGAWVSLT